MKKKTIWWMALGVLFIAADVAGWQWWQNRQLQLPDGIIYGNGRIEADQVDIAAKDAGRVREILACEGDLVEPGQVLVRMDIAELEAQLAEARAKVAEACAAVNQSVAEHLQRESESELAEQDLTRALPLEQNGSISQRTVDQRRSKHDTSKAAVIAAKATIETKKRAIDAARAQVKRIQAQIDDTVLKTPVTGRVLYRLAEPGEVLSAGGKILTIVNLSQVYMEIFLPSQQAMRIAIGSEARIVFDGADFVFPAKVSFVSPEAQFTPKQVETASEREKLMFRVKIRIPASLIRKHIGQFKTGTRGVAYVRPGWPNSPDIWPDFLQKRLPGDPVNAKE